MKKKNNTTNKKEFLVSFGNELLELCKKYKVSINDSHVQFYNDFESSYSYVIFGEWNVKEGALEIYKKQEEIIFGE